MSVNGHVSSTMLRQVRLPQSAGTADEPGAVVLAIEIDLGADPVRIRLTGDLCPYSAPFLDDELRILRRSSTEDVEMDLAGVEFFSCAGVRTLVGHAAAMAGTGSSLRITSTSSSVDLVLGICDLDEYFRSGSQLTRI